MSKSNPNIIPFSHDETKSWQQEIANSFKNLDDLLDYLEFDPNNRSQFKNYLSFPLRVTRFYADLIQKNDINDPLLLQVIPQAIEENHVENYTSDAVGDLDAIKVPGLIHKYYDRVLLSLTEACAIHCRYCFRREFPYADNIPNLSADGDIMRYLKEHPEIKEVILSGGDPLMLSDKRLSSLLQTLASFDHITTIRFHTRMPSLEPKRITPQLLDLFNSLDKHIVMVLHINHPNEVNDEIKRICEQLKSNGVVLFNQSVLLKNINDSIEVLKQLSLALFNSGILPYYIHSLDKVNGTAHFESPKEVSKKLLIELAKQLPGYLIPKLVEEIKGEKSKIRIF